ncbi:N-acetyl-gamma-glutamyl-phosphate reductase [Dolichospermum sp. ST_sed1]|nr:N-acetyl-gamma-glutamyl-phosphate reductase [Dolichospermum sp. ST_sed1]
MDKLIKVGVVGFTGYTGSELIRLLLNHIHVKISMVFSRSESGKRLSNFFPELKSTQDLIITNELLVDCDVIFLCLPHGQSKLFIEENQLLKKCGHIIDLSADYRQNLDIFKYGFVESHILRKTPGSHIAVPGCFATAIQLGLLPFVLQQSILSSIHITGVTGSTGAGAHLSETSHFSWRNDNMSVYKAFQHQHLEEIYFNFKTIHQSKIPEIFFVPMRGCFSRGILVSMYFQTNFSLEEANRIFDEYYQKSLFVKRTQEVHLKQVVNTNNAYIQVDKYKDQLHLVVAIDNLLKGASGQALENMNLLFNLPQDAGLKLKASMY